MNFKFLNSMPSSYYRWLALPALAIAGLLTWLVISYFVHGAMALESDPWLKDLAFVTVVALVASELMAGWISTMLSGQRFAYWCFVLKCFAGFIFVMELVMICAVQISGALQADMGQAKLAADAAKLEERIQKIERRSEEMDRTAAMQLDANQRKLSLQTSDKASAEDEKAEPLRQELKAIKAQLKPTLTTTMDFFGNIVGFSSGLAMSVAIIVARCVGLSGGALMFSMLSGALWRRGSTGKARPAETVYPVSPIKVFWQPGLLANTPSPAPQYEQAAPSFWARLMGGVRKMLPSWQQAAVVPATVGAASGVGAKTPEPPEPPQIAVQYVIKDVKVEVPQVPMPKAALEPAAEPAPAPAPAAPAAPAPETAPAPASPAPAAQGDTADVLVAGDPRMAIRMEDCPPLDGPPAKRPGVSVAEQPGVSVAEHPKAEKKPAKAQAVRKAKPLAGRPDTAISGPNSERFKRVKEGVIAELIKPSVRGIQQVEGGSSELVTTFLLALAAEGVIERKDPLKPTLGWVLSKAYLAKLEQLKAAQAQMSLLDEVQS